MKQITPISIWDKGQNLEGTILNAYAVNLTLNMSAVFYYQILSSDMQTLSQGNLTMLGGDYLAWDTDDMCWQWIAKKLNLTIIGDYVPPVVEEVMTQTQGNN
jgi:hypothetical protein